MQSAVFGQTGPTITSPSSPCAAARLPRGAVPKEGTVLSYEDCVGLSELTPEEIAAIASRLHVPEIVAVEMARASVGAPKAGR